MFNLVPWKTRQAAGDGGALAPSWSRDLQRFRDEFDALLDRFWGDAPWSEGSLAHHWGWGLDVDDRENEVVVRAEAPGFEPSEFNVQVRGDQLVIEAEHKEEKQGDHGSSYRYGKFQRMVSLPQGAKLDDIDAHYRNGVLEIHVPKGEEAKGRRITVKGG